MKTLFSAGWSRTRCSLRAGGIALALAAGALVACQSKSPEEDLIQQARPAGSWLATLRWTGEQWNANSVPKSFVKSTVAEARKDLDNVSDAAGKSKARPEARLPLLQLMKDSKAAGDALAGAARKGDRPGVARQVAQLAALQARFSAWQASAKQKQEGGAQ
ncbi:MAG TPA: hypothetical protein VGH73_06420 [Thermoanaerobaculia bacterium]|jgi:hypothetical protein